MLRNLSIAASIAEKLGTIGEIPSSDRSDKASVGALSEKLVRLRAESV